MIGGLPIIHWVSFSRGLVEAMDTLYDTYFHFCWELETWARDPSMNSLRVHDLGRTHSLASLQWSGLSNQQTLLLTENAYNDRNGAPKKGRWAVSTPVCAKRERNGPASADQGLSIASQDSHMCMACHNYARPPPPIPPFLLAQNLSSKQIAPTDNMRPKLHDEYTRHQWLKG